MEIPKETLESWNKLKEEGDVALIAKELKKAESTVYAIFNTGKCKVVDAKKINKFFKRRKKEVDSVKIDDGN